MSARAPIKLRDLISDPRKSLLGQLTLYYAGVAMSLYVLIRLVPDVAKYLYSWRGDGVDQTDLAAQITGSVTFRAMQADTAIALLVSTLGSLFLMVPVTWVYMGTRRRSGLDQSMVESLLVLPITVAGVVVIVQDSIPLAFSLAGIFAGIQFRSKLKFYADAHFLFAAIGVGLAAGIGALHVATVMSMCFSYASYVIWRLNYGAEAGERHLRYATERAKEVAHEKKVTREHKHEHRGERAGRHEHEETPDDTPAD